MIQTQRLVLRRWREADLAPLQAIHADPEVMVWLGGVQGRETSDAYVQRYESHFDEHGFGLWAVVRRDDSVLLGVTGLRRVLFEDHPRTPCVEAAWRMARHTWGQGYVTEAATAALSDGFERVGLDEVLAWTARTNLRSQAVMRRIGMVRAETLDFDHPALEAGDPLRPHVVFVARP